MTDTELRVREALARVAEDAPSPVGLAPAARRRARTRRRTWVAAGSALAVAAVVVPAALLAGGDVAGRGPVAPDPGTSPTAAPDPAPRVPDGWRAVTWKDLTLAVPGDWEEGGRSNWCLRGGPEVPRVQLPSTVVELVDCGDPQSSLGVTIGSGSAVFPAYPSGHVWQYDAGDTWDRSRPYLDGSWLGHFYDEDHLVQVNAADRDTVERILATLEVTRSGPALVWREVEHEGVTVEVPPTWEELDTSDCEFSFRSFGPPDLDPCGDGPGLAFYASATFDPAHGPGIHRDEASDTWGGYAYAGDYAVWVTDPSRALVRRVLDSVR